jgi:membrane associated rhomboid family serine protease
MGVMQQNRRNPILLGQDNNALTWLLIINSVIFIILAFINVLYRLSYDTQMEAMQNFHMQITDWVSLSGNADKLAMRPWTILTYMFSHENVWEMVGTLLWLWGFGYIFQDLTGNTKIIPVYIYGGLAGSVIFTIVSNLIPGTNPEVVPLFGGGAAVMAIAIATTTVAPKYRIFPMINGGISIWIFTLIFVAVDFAFIAGKNISMASAHLAGGIIGFLFILQMNRGYDMGGWMISFFNWVNDLFNPEKKYSKKPVRQQRFYKLSRKPFEKTPRVTQQKLDEILDKINQEGYDSLSDEEKDFLKKASQTDI